MHSIHPKFCDISTFSILFRADMLDSSMHIGTQGILTFVVRHTSCYQLVTQHLGARSDLDKTEDIRLFSVSLFFCMFKILHPLYWHNLVRITQIPLE